MGEVGDIEELLAALAQEDPRPQHINAQLHHHHDLSQIPVLPVDINFSLQASHSNMGLTDDGHIGTAQIPHCAAGGLLSVDLFIYFELM